MRAARSAATTTRKKCVTVEACAAWRRVACVTGSVSRKRALNQMKTKGCKTKMVSSASVHGCETYWKRTVCAIHPMEARTMGTMVITAPGRHECGARTFVAKPAAMKPGAMPSTEGSTMTEAWRALIVRLTSSTDGTTAWKGIRIMSTSALKALDFPFCRSDGALGATKASRILPHSRCKMRVARSTWPTSNCCTASLQPSRAWPKLMWQRSKLSMHGTANSSGKRPRLVQVVFSVSPTISMRWAKCSWSICSQPPRSMSWALSKLSATASSWTY
mmetsp:Transcript_138407/g.359685  ORF Transcript_138407/g.359685 Transcript_138407/m.359685 type:complete len:275 (+) Transcript_138407:769-1593(+)